MEPKISKATAEEKERAKTWPIWEKEESDFPWTYDEEELCYIIEGEVDVTNEEGKSFKFKKGDFVVFPKGMRCKWHVKKPVKKYYSFR
ncbi:MAG: cupin domain-containing protein [Nanoarchaeota archaeon]|nr:cupin domain-containing protein [Nanoarchaeota archaeon]